MSIELKNHFIEFFRTNGFNCFPIPEKSKIADFRYKAANTTPNQAITEHENYGIIPYANGTAIIDFDNKERYRKFCEAMIGKGYMIIESPHGWHMPVIGLSGIVTKTELFNYEVQPMKIVEIQGPDHYCVGAGSIILGDKKDGEDGMILEYKNVGTEKIWDAKGMNFNQFLDELCKQCNLVGKKRSARSSYQYMRERFNNGEIPTKGTSNDYFHQAAMQCNTDGLTREEAMDKIQVVWHKWSASDSFSGRSWDNIISKINDVYDNNQRVDRGRPKKEVEESVDRTEIAQAMIERRKLFSNVETHEIFENVNGFLEKINDTLKRELQTVYPQMEQSDYMSILFKLEGLAGQMPETNKNLIVFKNGTFDKKIKTTIETNELADMGFKNYDYLLPTKENEPTEFIRIMFSNVPKHEHPRIKAGLRAIFESYLDPKISVIYGNSGVGKSSPLTILTEILGPQYALTVELGQFLSDKFIKAKIVGMRLLVFQDLPKDWKDFTVLKTVTGEPRKTERGFMKDSVTFDNKLKIWGSCNYLAKIPDEEKDAMYTRRLSLIHNTRTAAYSEDPTFTERIVRDEGEKIVSWILNIPDSECKYEDKQTVKKEWERIASPEIGYLEEFWELSDHENEVGVMHLIKDFQSKYNETVSIEQMIKSLKAQGYVVKFNIIKNIQAKPQKQKGPVTLRNFES